MLVLQTYCGGFFFAWWGIKEHKTHLIMLLLHIWLRILMDFQTRQKNTQYTIYTYIRINTANYKVLFFRSVSLYMSYQCPEVFMTE